MIHEVTDDLGRKMHISNPGTNAGVVGCSRRRLGISMFSLTLDYVIRTSPLEPIPRWSVDFTTNHESGE